MGTIDFYILCGILSYIIFYFSIIYFGLRDGWLNDIYLFIIFGVFAILPALIWFIILPVVILSMLVYWLSKQFEFE